MFIHSLKRKCFIMSQQLRILRGHNANAKGASWQRLEEDEEG